MICEFCGYEFDDSCGRYGCPNCLGEGLDMGMTVKIPEGMRTVTVSEEIRLRVMLLLASYILHLDPFKHALNARWRKFYNDRSKHNAEIVPLQ